MTSDLSVAAPLGESVLVSETRLGHLQQVARTATSAFLVDEPQGGGGFGSGPNPYDLLSAALGACTSMTLRLYAERKGWPLVRVQVSVRHHRASLEARDLFERTISLEGPLDEMQRIRLLEIADRCPVHRTFDRGSDVRTVLSPAGMDGMHGAAGFSEHLRDMEEAGAV
jgi:putative redox protein